jgi:hypothetical protein
MTYKIVCVRVNNYNGLIDTDQTELGPDMLCRYFL